MEKDVFENGYIFVISEKLASLGYQESMIHNSNNSERYVYIPDSFRQFELNLPNSISRLEGKATEGRKIVKIPFDSIPLGILNFDTTKNIFLEHKGFLSNIQDTLEETKSNNPDFINHISKLSLSLEDFIIVSIDNSSTNILV